MRASRPISVAPTGCCGFRRTLTWRPSRATSSGGGWSVARLGLAAGAAAGESITDLYAAIYDVPRERVAEAGRLRGLAAEVRDRGATADPEGPMGPGQGYWTEVARLLRESYRSLRSALDAPDGANA